MTNALARKIAFYRHHFSCPPPLSSAYHEPGTILDEELRGVLEEHLNGPVKLPIYFKPADIIDEQGNLLIKDPKHSSNELEDNAEITAAIKSSEKIKNYLKKRFSQRAALARQQASLAAHLDTLWRTRNRRREADWGDPEDLGVPAVGGIAGHVAGKTWRDALCEWIPEQESVRVKTLIPSIYIRQCLRKESRESTETARIDTVRIDTATSNNVQWSDEEKKTFIELFLQFPKNFARISAALPLKSTEQCVQFYYLNKQRYRLKQMVVSYRRAMAGQRRLTLQGEVIATAVAAETSNEKRRVGRPKVRKE